MTVALRTALILPLCCTGRRCWTTSPISACGATSPPLCATSSHTALECRETTLAGVSISDCFDIVHLGGVRAVPRGRRVLCQKTVGFPIRTRMCSVKLIVRDRVYVVL